MTKNKGKKSKRSSIHQPNNLPARNTQPSNPENSPDLGPNTQIDVKNSPKVGFSSQQSVQPVSSSSHPQQSHSQPSSNVPPSIALLFPEIADGTVPCMSGVVGETVQLQYSKPSPSSQSHSSKNPSESVQPLSVSNPSEQTQEDSKRSNQSDTSSNGPSAPPHLPSDQISFQEFLQSKEVAKIHDTARKFAQLRLQQFQNDHTALTEEQLAQINYFLEDQHLLPASSSNNSLSPTSESQRMANEQYAANVNAISSLATMAAAAALHNFEKANGSVDILSDSDAVAIANSIKLPLPQEEFSKIGNFPGLSNLSNMTIKEVSEWVSRDAYSFVHGSPATANPAIRAVSQKTQQKPPLPASTPSTASQQPSSSPTNNHIGLTPEQQHFRQQVMQYDRHVRQSESYKNPAHTVVSSSQVSGHIQSLQEGIYNANMYALKRSMGSSPTFIPSDRFKGDRIWDTSTEEEKERVRQFWQELSYEDRRELVKIPKDTVMRKMKELKRTNCNCLMCGKKRLAIEELENLYEAYHLREVERSNKTGNYLRPASHDSTDGAGSECNSSSHDQKVFNFSNTLTIQGGVLTVADDLLKNNGKKFIDMMDLLQQRRQEREQNEAEAMANYEGGPIEEDEGEFTEDDGKYEDEYEEYEGEGSEEENEEDYEEECEDEDSRWDASKKLLHQFAIKIFEKRLMDAYREKVAKDREEKLLEELEEEERQEKERDAKKLLNKEKKKERKRLEKQQKEEERLRKEAEIEKQQAAIREAQRQKAEEAQRKKLELKKKKEEEQRRQEQEHLRKLEEERKKAQLKKEQEEKERREKQEREEKLLLEKKQEKERLLKEQKEKERLLKEQKEKERKLKEQKEKEERLLKKKMEAEERQLKAKKEKERRELELKKQEEKRQQELEEKEKQRKQELELKRQQELKEKEEEMRLEQELKQKEEAERIAKEKELEAAKAKRQHQQQLLTSLRQHVPSNGESEASIGPNQSAPASDFSNTANHGFNAMNNFVTNPSATSTNMFNPTLGGPQGQQFGQQYNYPQPNTVLDGSFHSLNGSRAMGQRISNDFKTPLQQNPQAFDPYNSGSNNSGTWAGNHGPPNQGFHYAPTGNMAPPGLQPNPANNYTNSSQDFLENALRSMIAPKDSSFENNNPPSLGGTSLNRVPMNTGDYPSSYSLTGGNTLTNNMQRSQSNSNVPNHFISNRNAVGDDSFPKTNAPLATDYSFSQPFSQTSVSQNEPAFGQSSAGGASGNNRKNELWNSSNNIQTMSTSQRGSSLWNTEERSGWVSSPTAENMASSFHNNANSITSSLTSGSLVSGPLSTTSTISGSLLNNRSTISAVSEDLIRAAAVTEYHKYSQNPTVDGKVSSQLLYVNTLNNLSSSTGIRFNQQEFFNACEKPDENGMVHFDLTRNFLGLVTHLKHKLYSGSSNNANAAGANSLNMQSPISSPHGGVSLASKLTPPTSTGLTSASPSPSSLSNPLYNSSSGFNRNPISLNGANGYYGNTGLQHAQQSLYNGSMHTSHTLPQQQQQSYQFDSQVQQPVQQQQHASTLGQQYKGTSDNINNSTLPGGLPMNLSSTMPHSSSFASHTSTNGRTGSSMPSTSAGFANSFSNAFSNNGNSKPNS